MKYALSLSVLGLCQIMLVFINPSSGPVLWLFLWSGLAWILAGLAYTANAAWVFGKRADGGMNSLYVAVFFPFLLVTHLLWHVQRMLTREPATAKSRRGCGWGGVATPPNCRPVFGQS